MSEEALGEGRPEDAHQQAVKLTQSELDRLIDRKFGDGYAKAEAKFAGEIERLRARLTEVESDNERLSRAVKEDPGDGESGELDQLRGRVAELAGAEKRAALVSAAARAGAVDPELVCVALAAKLGETQPGRFVPLRPDGTVVLDEDNQPVSLDAFVAGFLAERPYLARPASRGGSGMAHGASAAVGSLEGLTPEDLRKMNADERRELLDARSAGSFRW